MPYRRSAALAAHTLLLAALAFARPAAAQRVAPPDTGAVSVTGVVYDSISARPLADAIVQFVRALEEAEDVTFVDFDTRVNLGFFKPASYPHLFERIRARQAKGWTALYDAIGVYLERALSISGQHVLVLYTDGGDSTSRMTFGQLTDLLRLGNVLVYVMGYLENQSSSQRAPLYAR